MIWIVTDHHRTRSALVPLIAAKGYAVAEIDCGDEVLKRIPFQDPALIVIDCGMPDSFATLTKIRAHLRRRIPVVMFSTSDANHKAEALLRGADGYVAKGSLDWVELLAEIARLAGPPPA
jgi:two-component system alkaline phosphatase synthesis response regulator PhoP